jgi:hypothetical protein
MSKISEDLAEMKKKLKKYVDKGREVGYHEVREEPVIVGKPDGSKIKPLRKVSSCDANFLAVDCSTRTLKRANNWGIYLLRTTYALVKGRKVDWGYEEHVSTVTGDPYTRSNFLTHKRMELESELVLNLLSNDIPEFCYEDPRSNYVLLDGGSYFGGQRKFRVSLYEECEKHGIRLLAISKNSPSLHDDKGRDFIAATSMLSPYGTWVYYPVRKADKHQTLYGDVSLVKLCKESRRVFRCDIMEYLTDCDMHQLISPLTFISEDPRCVGYPVALWLAHDFSAPSDSMLLHYHDQVEETLATAGLLDVLRVEEFSCNFPDELHSVKHPFQWERIEHV